MKRFRYTLLAVCLVLLWLGWTDISFFLANRTPAQLSIQQLERFGPPRDWLQITGGRLDLEQAISTSGTLELDALLVPLKSAPDVEKLALLVETRDPGLLELFRTYHFMLDTPSEQAGLSGRASGGVSPAAAGNWNGGDRSGRVRKPGQADGAGSVSRNAGCGGCPFCQRRKRTVEIPRLLLRRYWPAWLAALRHFRAQAARAGRRRRNDGIKVRPAAQVFRATRIMLSRFLSIGAFASGKKPPWKMTSKPLFFTSKAICALVKICL